MSDYPPNDDKMWRAKLSSEEYNICREKGTEPAFSGIYWNHKGEGSYCCKCCGTPLFSSDTKYDSGSGWPSFYKPTDASSVGESVDRSHGMARTEIVCSNCHCHLGHVFTDGPQPSGLRYCVNSASLDFESDAS